MNILEIKDLEIPGVKVIKFGKFRDDRGYFMEPFRKSDVLNYKELRSMYNLDVCQTNQSYSKKNVVRGLHFQWNPYMGKLIRTINGSMIDFFLDIRKNSPTLGKIIGYELTADENSDYEEWIWLPVGLAHGNMYLKNTTIEYFCSGEYSPKFETGISILSKDIDWSLCDDKIKKKLDSMIKDGSVIMSDKDKNARDLTDWINSKEFTDFDYNDLKSRNLC